MRMTDPSLPVEKFEAIYKDFEGLSDFQELLKTHLKERVRYLGLLDRALADALEDAPEGAHAIELGCGTGIDSCILARRYPRVNFWGIDIAGGSLSVTRRAANQLGQRLHLARGDVFQLPFRSGAFSLVFHQGLVEHFPDPAAMMAEQFRLLRPGGWAVISVPQTFTGYTVMKARRIRAGTWPWGWETHYTKRGLEALGRRAGLVPAQFAGEGYWRSWGEPAWVARDLWGKFDRRNPLRRHLPFPQLLRLWEAATAGFESAFGHLFCRNVIVAFQKPS